MGFDSHKGEARPKWKFSGQNSRTDDLKSSLTWQASLSAYKIHTHAYTHTQTNLFGCTHVDFMYNSRRENFISPRSLFLPSPANN